jgi:hypothetical protein
MKVFLYFLSFYTINSFALIPGEVELPPHSKFFKNYYLKYSKWFSSNVYNWDKELTVREKKIFQTSIEGSTHWTDSNTGQQHPHILWGIGYHHKTNKQFYTLEMTIFKKSLPIFTKKEVFKRLKISTIDNSLCLTTDSKRWDCYNRKTFNLINTKNYLSRVSLHPPFYSYEIQNSNKGESTYIYSNEFHITQLPKNLRKVVVQHGRILNLPLDKIEMTPKKRFTVFYP